MGINLDFAAGEGPVIHNPIGGPQDVDILRVVEPRETLGNVLQAIRLVRRELGERTALIGFAGGPFTLASYMIEAGSSRNYAKTKRLMYNHPGTWRQLMEKLSTVVGEYLVAQVEAGAQAVQLFDSWVGALSPDDYREYVQPYSRRIFEGLRKTGAPAIHFGTGTAALLPDLQAAGGSVIGIDWQTPLDWGWQQLGQRVAVQGNLDPVALFATPEELGRRVLRILQQAGGKPGHIFNLGHGILPETPVENVQRVVDLVHSFLLQDQNVLRG
jgi:uroporphyrinogen decarboxylase